MSGQMLMSADAKVVVLPTFSIRNTNTAADATWAVAYDVRGYKDIYAKLVVGATFNANDNVTTCKLQQCNTAAGGGAKDLTTSASAGNYDTDNPLDAAGNSAVLEARTMDMDIANGFYYVRLYGASTDNTAQDDVMGVIILYNADQKYAQREAAASTGAVQYGVANG